MTVDAYFVCATPRTGSSLLLGLLGSTGVAGRPEAYFRAPDEQAWAARWQLAPGFGYASFVAAAIRAGRTDNGVFGAKLMWGTLDEVVAKLATGGTDLDALTAAFGRLRFVHLWRDDVLAQAVSWLRAEQTTSWFAGDPGGNGQEPAYDEAAIGALLSTIDEHTAAWRQWFAAAGVTPHPVRYEDLAADPVGVATGILDFLGLELPPGRSIRGRHRRQSDEVNRRWQDRFRRTAPG